MMLFVAGFISSAASPANAAASDPLGISPGGDLLWLSDAELARELDLYKATGMTWVRVDFDWPSIEQSRGNFTWGATDRVVNAATARGLKVLALPTYTPLWATSVPGQTHAGPANPADFATFVAKAVNRYKSSGVRHWEIWNEPNLKNFWAPKPDPAAYTTLLRRAYSAIKAADPAATVLAGALSPATDPADGSQVSPVTFTTRMYANGAKGSFDALSVHPYCYPAMPDDATTSSWNTFQRLPLVRDVMVANGDSDKQIWLTEFGAPTGTGSGAVSESVQAQMLTRGIATAAQWSWTGPLFIYGGRDRGTDPADREQNFGFVRTDYTPKAALSALTTYLQNGGGTNSPAPPIEPTTVPGTPTDVRVASVTRNSASVSWKVAPADQVSGYRVQLRRGAGSWTTVATGKDDASNVTLSNLASNTSYSVRVSVWNSIGASNNSPAVIFRTLGTTRSTVFGELTNMAKRPG